MGHYYGSLCKLETKHRRFIDDRMNLASPIKDMQVFDFFLAHPAMPWRPSSVHYFSDRDCSGTKLAHNVPKEIYSFFSLATLLNVNVPSQNSICFN